MSEPDEEIRGVIDGENGKKKRGGGGFLASFRKAKKMVKQRLFRKTKKKKKKNWGCGGESSSGGCLGKRVLGGCFAEPGTGESSFRSNTSDPNDPNFTYGMLKSMIEKNDFYSRECNTHLEFKRE